jgi:hypothetical protein
MNPTFRSMRLLPVRCALVLCAAMAGSGCGSGRNVTVGFWQKNIEQYVRQQGKGDPTVLRDLSLPDTRRGFSAIGSDSPADSYDANGVLLGFRQVQGHEWFIYLVGVIRKQNVEEIRLAALHTDGAKFEWRTGANNPAALQKYREYGQQLWRKRFPQRGAPPPSYLGFPRAEDQFQLTVNDSRITTKHVASGAQWELALPAPARQPRAPRR